MVVMIGIILAMAALSASDAAGTKRNSDVWDAYKIGFADGRDCENALAYLMAGNKWSDTCGLTRKFKIEIDGNAVSFISGDTNKKEVG